MLDSKTQTELNPKKLLSCWIIKPKDSKIAVVYVEQSNPKRVKTKIAVVYIEQSNPKRVKTKIAVVYVGQ